MKKQILSLLFLLAVFVSSALGQRTVTGTVSDDAGEPLLAVTVVVVGTSGGTVTDQNGHYSIEVPDENSTLSFSFIGMETKQVTVGNRTIIDVTMATSAVALEDVVVTALGISREKKSLGYSVGEVEGEALQQVAQENVLNSLAGRVSGVTINSTGGAGSSVSMVIGVHPH